MPRTRNPVILTDRETEVLQFIKQYHRERGYSPSLRDICKTINVDSTSLASYYLDNLQKAGLIRRDPNISRSIVLLEGAGA